MNRTMRSIAAASVAVGIIFLGPAAFAQAPAPAAPAARAARPPAVVSPEVSADRHITFRILAPDAQGIRLSAGDIPGVGQGTQLTKGENGIWSVTLGPVEPGAYRYSFAVDGVTTIDPANPSTSESNTRVWSLVAVPGSDVMDTKNVPHGAVAAVTYYSTALGAFRRMHVYTPPGYGSGSAKFPVFYLLHGAGDSDDSWTSVGRAGFILDNLIAAKQARPMVVVMPAGHTTRGAAPAAGRSATQDFVSEFNADIAPYIAKNYRVLTDRADTAIAGLSMGGSQTLQIAVPQLEKFGYIGVFSSGLLGAFPRQGRGAAPAAAPAPAAPAAAPAAPVGGGAGAPAGAQAAEWEQQNAAKLDDANLKKGLKLLWFSTGSDDGLMPTTKGTVALFEKHGFKPVFKESPGGHTWLNWRAYLAEFAPQLFK
jgi:enterochelin esterase family protein